MQRTNYNIKRPSKTNGYTTYFNYRMEKSSDGQTWTNVDDTYGNGVLNPHMAFQKWHFMKFKYQFPRSFYDYYVRLVVSYDWYEGDTSASKKVLVEKSNIISIYKMDTSMVWEQKPTLIYKNENDDKLKYGFNFWMLENTNLNDYKFVLSKSSDGSKIETNSIISQVGSNVARVEFEFEKKDIKKVNLGFERSILNTYGYDWTIVGTLNIDEDSTIPPVMPPVQENNLKVSFSDVLSGISKIVQEKQFTSNKLVSITDSEKYTHFGSAFKFTSEDEYNKNVDSMTFSVVSSGTKENMNVTIKLKSPYTFIGGDDYSIGSFAAYSYDYYSTNDKENPANDTETINNNLESNQQKSNNMSSTSIALISVMCIMVVLTFVFLLIKIFKKQY